MICSYNIYDPPIYLYVYIDNKIYRIWDYCELRSFFDPKASLIFLVTYLV